MRSDVFFNLGYASLWVGLFAVTRGLARWAVVFLFHVVTMLVVAVTTLAHLYLWQTGDTLDYGTVAEWVSRLDEMQPSLYEGGGPLSVRVLLFAALFYTASGPQLVTRAVERVARWRGGPGRFRTGRPKISFLGSIGLLLLALGFGWLSLLTGAVTPAQAPVVNLALTGLEETSSTEEDAPDDGSPATGLSATDTEATTEEDNLDAGPADNLSAVDAVLAETPRTEKRNVVLIHLESTRAQSATPYDEDLKTMPFLGETARSSLLAERAYAVVPRSSKGSTAVNCGVEPPHYPGPEFEPGRIPSPCLGGLLKEQGYRTVWFQSVSNAANSHWDDDLARNLGYEEFYSPETMNTQGYQATNSFGYEEDIMLGPSEGWLVNNGYDGPFLAEYFTGTGHYGYDCVPNRYGYESFSEDEELDRYHNCLRMLDFFLQNLFDQYQRLGLYEDTIFVLYGDHGEGFREHRGRYMHGDTIYEEGIRIPLIVHDPKRVEDGERAQGLSSQIDVLPTVLDLLGYEVENGEYPGYSLLNPVPEDRTIRSNCIANRKCMASIRGFEKYVYNYGNLPDEFFDLSEDPYEQNNLADERSEEEINERREDLLEWRRRDDAEYGPITFEGTPYQGAAYYEDE
ncbi:MAG: sulfatase-like hydrolase/transferase [Actinobacteria bacterium]|nr:sulfatase-like hydrolase/transferase [Actinomycetota bacterium]